MRFRFSILGIGFSFGNYSIKPDENLAGRDLRGRYFAGANLRGRDLRGANLAGTNLRGRDLRGANLTGANLTGANLTPDIARGLNHNQYRQRANLTSANLTSANLTGANLTGANLTNANLTSANLTGANLTNALGVPLRREGSNLASANLLGANPAGMTIREWAAKQKAEENQNVLRRWLGANLTGATMPDGTIHE